MAKLKKFLREVKKEVKEKSWEVGVGDLILVKRTNGSYTFGYVESISDDGQNYTFRHPALRLSYNRMGDKVFPTVEIATKSQQARGDNSRQTSSVLEITVGKGAVAQKIRKLSPRYEQYASEIEK